MALLAIWFRKVVHTLNGVPHFRSGQDPEVFFYKLETYAAANNKDIDTMYTNLAMYLDDQVTRWLMDQPQAVLTDSTKLKAVIKARYSSQEKGTSMQCLRNRTCMHFRISNRL